VSFKGFSGVDEKTIKNDMKICSLAMCGFENMSDGQLFKLCMKHRIFPHQTRERLIATLRNLNIPQIRHDDAILEKAKVVRMIQARSDPITLEALRIELKAKIEKVKNVVMPFVGQYFKIASPAIGLSIDEAKTRALECHGEHVQKLEEQLKRLEDPKTVQEEIHILNTALGVLKKRDPAPATEIQIQ
jgi:hypothetical protein